MRGKEEKWEGKRKKGTSAVRREEGGRKEGR